jgi:hypothetical protein
MQVILGLCTASQREEAKTLNTDRATPVLAAPHKLIPVHLSAVEISAIDAWIAHQPDKGAINRAEAVHRLLRTSLPHSETTN